MLGNIATNLQTSTPASAQSLLHSEISKFVQFISIIALSMAVIFFLIGIVVARYVHMCSILLATSPVTHVWQFRFENILYHFVTGFLIIVVANVPQGLPAMVMSQLAIIARRMAKKNVFIKKLDVIDELGATSVICTDKSGTLTQNLMLLTGDSVGIYTVIVYKIPFNRFMVQSSILLCLCRHQAGPAARHETSVEEGARETTPRPPFR